jgi:cytochrome c oxidase subunit I
MAYAIDKIMINLRIISLSWLPLGLLALAISGLFSIILAVAWHPSVKSVSLFATLFHRSLIAHVNLSITVWFLCCAFMVMDAGRAHWRTHLPYADATAKWLMGLTIALMTCASLQPQAKAVLCNYIPMLQHPLFFLSLGCLFAAVMLKLLDVVVGLWGVHTHDIAVQHNRIMVVILLASCGCFVVSGAKVQSELNLAEDPLIYGEMLFWGGGHVLQYAWVQLMLFAWVAMLSVVMEDITYGRGLAWIMRVNLLAVATSPLPYLLYDVTSGDFRQMFTWLMAWMSGMSPILFMIYYVWVRVREKKRVLPAYRDGVSATLWWSWVLFALGGAFAIMIDGINVKIPAHYHGSLLGVTMAMMGLVYVLLQAHGYSTARCRWLIMWQPLLLGIGQVMHIVGLFWSGGYGVQRKSPLQEGEAMKLADVALRIQSSGGGIAIIGGLLFLVVCYKMWHNHKIN